ncbi:MAG TPA: hydantoinase/oxoprolinase family protein [Candidatus Acidoferrales bacterium]|nr:hydantoinase/oxoprolinase family protein [Candidatus Acidoferrales bacterium]
MLRVAVDIGGTFTDLVAIDDESSKLFVLKVKSTPATPEDAFIYVIRRLVSENQIPPSKINKIVHVGTIGSNLFLGQLGIRMPKTALVTTQGFRDVIEIGRQNRSELYNVFFQRPRPLVPRKLRFEVKERTDSQGNILTAVLDEDLQILWRKLKDAGVESVAISFLNSYLNPENERKTKDALAQVADFIFTSFEIDPEHREYERTSTTTVNAVLAPVVSRYLNSALTKLKDAAITSTFLLLSSSGGLVDIEAARSKPIVSIESGPAAGVVGAAEVAKMLGYRNVLSLDMGGTTAKAGCIVDYTPLVVPEMEVGGRVHLGRVIKGSGYPVRYPSIDLAEVSAGGGTIVWADEIGTLRVGPISAGAEPGPACYSSGGNDATITDANLMLGRLGSTLLGREMQLDVELARESMERVAGRVKMSAVEVAAASIRLVNLHMARAVDIVSLERGQDPRNFSLIAFGGAGPMHAAELAEQVGVNLVIIPPFPGLFSALGMMMTDMKYAYVRGILKPLDDLSDDLFEETWKEMTQEALSSLKAKTDNETAKITAIRSVDVRYFGQGFELEIQVPRQFNRHSLRESFELKHEMVYGYRHAGEPLEVTALRLTVTIPVVKPNLDSLQDSTMKTRAEGRRNVWFNDEWLDTSLYWRDELPPSHSVSGPAIIEEYDSTIVVPPNWDCRQTRNNCLSLERKI